MRSDGSHVGNAGLEVARRFRQAATETFQELAEMPDMGAPGKVRRREFAGVRLWKLKGFESYLIFYFPRKDGVAIERPSEDDLSEAAVVCQELGLGPLLERMPGGLQQMVGETGWQLSHGERSRVFIARALLQKTDLVILDESFGALDPENLRQALEFVLHRVRTLLVVAHP